MLLLGDIVIEVTGGAGAGAGAAVLLASARVVVVTDVGIVDDECSWCSYDDAMFVGGCSWGAIAECKRSAAEDAAASPEVAHGLNSSGGGLTTIRLDTASSNTSCTKIYCSKVWIRKLRWLLI